MATDKAAALRGRVQAIVVALLLALPPLNNKLRGAHVGRPAELGIGLRLLNRSLQLNELPPSLFELLIEVGRRDRRQDLVLRHMGAEVFVPGGDVSARAGEERARVESGDIARKNQLLFCRSVLGPDNADSRNRLRVSPGRDFLSALGAIRDAEKGEAGGADRKNADEQQNPARFGRLDRRRGRFRLGRRGGSFRGHDSSGSGVRG